MGRLLDEDIVIDIINFECGKWTCLAKTIEKEIKALPSAQPERLTDDDFETIRIHLNAYKEKLCNQQRWEEADEYQRIIDRFMAFASAQPTEASCWGCNCQKMERLKEQKTFSEMVHLHDAETHEERAETHTCDLISRQAAIDVAKEELENGTFYDIPGKIEVLPPAQPEPHWIPCSERLPEVGTYVLISKKALGFRSNLPSVCTAHRTHDPRSGKEEWNDMLFGKLNDDDVLAWMSLPEPYEER